MKMTKKTKSVTRDVFIKNNLNTKSAMHGTLIENFSAMHGTPYKKRPKKAYFELKLSMPLVAQIKKASRVTFF